MTRWVAPLVLVFACGGCQTTPGQLGGTLGSPSVQNGAALADSVISVLEPRLARIEGGLHGAQESITHIEADREANGIDPDKPIGTREWMEIAGGLLIGLLGLNQARNKKYVDFFKRDPAVLAPPDVPVTVTKVAMSKVPTRKVK
jgi:hypothetical protein